MPDALSPSKIYSPQHSIAGTYPKTYAQVVQVPTPSRSSNAHRAAYPTGSLQPVYASNRDRSYPAQQNFQQTRNTTQTASSNAQSQLAGAFAAQGANINSPLYSEVAQPSSGSRLPYGPQRLAGAQLIDPNHCQRGNAAARVPLQVRSDPLQQFHWHANARRRQPISLGAQAALQQRNYAALSANPQQFQNDNDFVEWLSVPKAAVERIAPPMNVPTSAPLTSPTQSAPSRSVSGSSATGSGRRPKSEIMSGNAEYQCGIGDCRAGFDNLDDLRLVRTKYSLYKL